MEMGMVGLGRMGGNMVLRLLKRGHTLIAFDQSPDAVKAHAAQGATGANRLEDFVKAFKTKPRVMWVMVPAGDPTTQTINKLVELGEPGDIIIDGGNTNWKIALQDAARVKAKGMHYVDAGTSGGIWGLEYGYCLMVGAEQDIYDHCLPLLKDLAPDDGGLVRTGPEGSGHFVKMVHNGVEYGLMQAYAEGFQVMKLSKSFPGMNMQAIEESVPVPIIAESLFARFRSRMENTFGDRMLAMMRNQFGGHAVVTDAKGEAFKIPKKT